MMRILLASFFLTSWICGADSPAAKTARSWREANEKSIADEFRALLSLPNIARNVDDIRINASHIQQLMKKRGIATELLRVEGAPPAIYGELLTPGAARTIVFYAHYDGQPVEPSQWVDSGPFAPILKDAAGGKIAWPERKFDPEWRIQARSASDDKAPILAMLTALDAFRAGGVKPRANVKFFFDGEEEAGSPHIGQYVSQFQEKLKADAWIFCDGPVHQTRRQQIVFGARGSMGFNVKVYGPVRELHSGHYGNWAPNPAAMLARLVASLRDDEGRVLVPGFYDDVEPLSGPEKAALARVPDIEAELLAEMGLGRSEGAGKRLDELINLPSLNIRGLAAAGVDAQSRNVIPTHATASIDVRLVKGMNHARTFEKILAHIRAQGYHIVDTEPGAAMRKQHPKVCRVSRASGYNGVRAPMDSAIARDVIAAVTAARGDVILLPTLGGSLPIAPIVEVLQVPVIIVPIANHDNNQHSHNENIRIQNLWDGIETMAALLAM